MIKSLIWGVILLLNGLSVLMSLIRGDLQLLPLGNAITLGIALREFMAAWGDGADD